MITDYQNLEAYKNLYHRDKVVFDYLVSQFNLSKASNLNLYIITKGNKEITEHLGIAGSTFNKMLMRIEKAGLIIRNREYNERVIEDKTKGKKPKKEKKESNFLKKYLDKKETVVEEEVASANKKPKTKFQCDYREIKPHPLLFQFIKELGT